MFLFVNVCLTFALYRDTTIKLANITSQFRPLIFHFERQPNSEAERMVYWQYLFSTSCSKGSKLDEVFSDSIYLIFVKHYGLGKQ